MSRLNTFLMKGLSISHFLLAGSAGAIIATQTWCTSTIWIAVAVLNFRCHKICFNND